MVIKESIENNQVKVCLNCRGHNRLNLQERVFNEISEEIIKNNLTKKNEKISRFGAEGIYIEEDISNKIGKNIGIQVYSPFILFPNKRGNVTYRIIYSSYQSEKEELQDCNGLSKMVTSLANMINKYDNLV